MVRKPLVLAITLLVTVGLLARSPAPARAQGREHCGTITNNETWGPSGNPHLVKCDVVLQHSTLNLQPDTTIFMAEGTSIIVKAGSSIQAPNNTSTISTAIVQNSAEDTPGFWGQLRFESGAAPSVLNNLLVRGGGIGNVPMIEVQDVLVVINRSILHNSLGVPLSFYADRLGPSLDEAGNVGVGNECQGEPHPLLQLDARAEIEVWAGEHPVTETTAWHHFCASYKVHGDVVIAGPDQPLLKLDKGVTLQFEPGAGMILGLAEDRQGQLDASGQTEMPVVFTGQTKEPGSWRGLDITAWSGISSLINTRVEYGGGGGRPMVKVETVDALTVDCTFEHALGYPLAVMADGAGPFLSGLASGLVVPFADNGIQRVLVTTNPEGPDITAGNADWVDPGIPYELDGSLTIDNGGLPTKLTLQAGATLLFRGDEALEVGNAATLLALGDLLTDKPVTLTSADGQTGSWRGLVVTDQADLVELDQVVVANGGAGGGAMVVWGKTDGSVTSTTFQGAKTYPISIPLSRAPDVIMGTAQLETGDGGRNTFTGNGVDRVLVTVDGPVTATRLKDWADPGAPVEFDGTVTVASTGGPRLVWHDGLDLRFRPGASLQVAGTNLRGNLDIADDDPDQPVRLGPADEAAGWSGLQILANGTLSGADLELSGAPAGVANLLADGSTVEMTALQVHGQQRGLGLDARNTARVTLAGSSFRDLEIGLRTRSGARLDISKSIVQGNTAWGLQNEDPTVCQRALQVWWGKATGPQDDSDASDGCMNAKNASPGADKVSNDVEWWPYAINDTDFTASQGIGPNAKRIFLPYAFVPPQR